MPKNEIGEYDETDSGNTDISGIGLSDATLIDQLDNIARAQMGALKRWFKSSLFRLRDSTDQTKLLAFDLSGQTTAVTRTQTTPNYSGVMASNAKGTNIASATTTDIGAATGDFVDVTGTTTITGLGTVAAGVERTVRFTGILTLTHNATSLILAGGTNVTTYSGLVMVLRSLGSGNWVEVGRSGAWITLTAGTVSNQATLDIPNIPAAASAVKIYITNFAPVTDGQSLLMRTSTDGGSSYDSGASDYWYTQLRSVTGGATSNLGGQSSGIFLSGAVGNAAGELLVGQITIMNPGLGQPCMMTYETHHIDGSGSTYYAVSGGGARRASADVNAIRLLFNSGNLNSGQYTVEYRL